MGMIEKRIAVLATDEAYEMTKNKMAQADQERKEVRYVRHARNVQIVLFPLNCCMQSNTTKFNHKKACLCNHNY